MGVSRRNVIAGIGSATAAGALAGFGTAHAAPPEPGELFGDVFGDEPSTAVDRSEFTEAVILKPDLTYINIDPSAFQPLNASNGLQIGPAGAGLATPPGALIAPIPLPVGAVLREAILGYLNPSGSALMQLGRKPLTSNYEQLGSNLVLPAGAAAQTAMFDVSSTVVGVDGQSSFMAVITLTTTAQRVLGLLVGYASPALAFVPVSPVSRVLDTRLAGGKLDPNVPRTVGLGVPSFARAAVFNLTVVETEGPGFLAAFPGGAAYNGNSNVNWTGANAVVANGVICAVDNTGSIQLQCGGAGRTHVLVDVQGYLL